MCLLSCGVTQVTISPTVALFVKMAEEGKLCMVALDEAHLIQSWKNFRYYLCTVPDICDHILPMCSVHVHTFCHYRPEYGSLQEARHFFPTTPVVALTATASTTQRQALLQMLRTPTTEVASVNKPNIYYRVIEFNPPSKPGKIILLS